MSDEYKQREQGQALHRLAVLWTLVATGLPAVALFFVPGLLFYDWRCDEGCRVQTGPGATPATHGWRYVRDAWQWSAQFWGMAVPGVIAAMLVVLFVAKRRPRAATAALIASALLYAAYAVFYVTGGHNSVSLSDVISHPWAWLPYTLMVIGGLIGIHVERRDQRNGTLRLHPRGAVA